MYRHCMLAGHQEGPQKQAVPKLLFDNGEGRLVGWLAVEMFTRSLHVLSADMLQ